MATMTIGQLARTAGVHPRTLRYYERIGLLRPSGRSAAGYRLYTQSEAERLGFIRRAQQLGLKLAEIAEVIAVREGGAAPCRHVRDLAEAKIEDIDRRIAELETLRGEMARLAELARDVEPECTRSSAICLAFEPSSTP
ncbi:MAG: heavy metal-responsive transcriptional regulator [Ardenticatenaceae bacterium]|nr:heavy metal-responsive transcriptional regulator [Ardenticatenaceae bacterium]